MFPSSRKCFPFSNWLISIPRDGPNKKVARATCESIRELDCTAAFLEIKKVNMSAH
jgi:hypothetical protein